MTNDPYSTHRPHLDPAVWAEYERRNLRARSDYRRNPSEFNKPAYCIECSEPKAEGRKTLRCATCERANLERAS